MTTPVRKTTTRSRPRRPGPARRPRRPTHVSDEQLSRAFDEATVIDEANRQDIRLAVVLNGGVSLAVWISGVVLELHNLVQASRQQPAKRGTNAYSGLLDLLDATARIDVVSGTSAGGLNGGFLSLGLQHGCDLTKMRQLWRDQGDLSALLRDPRQKKAPSLLRGEYFFNKLAAAYDDVYGTRSDGIDAPAGQHVELYLTGTLWKGRRTPFSDDLGRSLVEVDYDATFLFSSDAELVGDVPGALRGDLRHSAVASELAVASRCTSSFPGAFEPYMVTIDKIENRDKQRDADTARVNGRWPSSAGLANFSESQYVVDGGVLLNKPIRPAIDAIYRQPASRQVRRVLAYVVPDPGEKKQEPTTAPEVEDVPHATEVLLGVLTRLRSTDSVSAELAEIERRNQDVRQRRRTRDRLAQALLDAAPTTAAGPDLVTAAFDAYLEVRKDTAARTVSQLLLSGAPDAQWSRHELATLLRDIADEQSLPFVPAGGLADALRRDAGEWDWGQSVVGRLGDMTLDVLRRAVWLAPRNSDERAAVVALRQAVHEVLKEVRKNRRTLNDYWKAKGRDLPGRGTAVVASADRITALKDYLVSILDGWEGEDDDARRRRRESLHGNCLTMAAALAGGAAALRSVAAQERAAADPGGEELRRFRRLIEVLLTSDTAEGVLHCMLRLEVLQVAFAGASPEPEQEVELVQISSATPELLTGIQEHHFGAFYRSSWRVNDWLRGRLDGSTQLVQMLLAPERLRQRGWRVEDALRELRAVAVGPEGPHHDELAESWERDLDRIRAELQPLDGSGLLPRTFPLCAKKIADRLHVQILGEELPELVAAVKAEPDAQEQSREWALIADEDFRAGKTLPLGRLKVLNQGSHEIGKQRIRAEALKGTDTFARTTTHGAAALASMVSAVDVPKRVGGVLLALRGYALLVWVLVNHLTSKSRFGTTAVALAVGVGGALLALALLVPGVPVLVPLLGAVLLLGASTASALARRTAVEAPPWARIAAAFGVLLLVVVAFLLAQGLSEENWRLGPALEHLGRTLGRGIAQLAVVVAVIGLGWFLAGARPPEEKTSRGAKRRSS